MKTKLLILIILGALIIPTIQSCKKYSEGPTLSLRPRVDRVANRWQVENYKVNGNDQTSLVSGYVETFSKGNAYSYSWGNLSGYGTWAFHNNEEEIQLHGNDDQSSRTLVIVKLEEKSFWYYYIDGNDKHEVHLVPN